MNNIEKIRHSLAHIMAASVKELWPEVKFGIGPSIDNGFYYDFDFKDIKIGEENLKEIEQKMKELIKRNINFEKTEILIDEAIKKEKNQEYKKDLLMDLKKEGEKKVSYYSFGDFNDLCKGPHINSSKEINIESFKLDKVAGAYWKGDEKNKMLTRVYGIAFNTKKELNDYIDFLKEAELRDHRKISSQLDLYHIDEIVGLGLPLWHPKGAIIWRVIEDFWYKEHLKNGYQLVRSPHIGNRKLWEKSGHWGFYNESMYPPIEVGQTLKDVQDKNKAEESDQYLLKPMNCPFHIQIFKNSLKSYKELPIRLAECGTVYRYEKKGELSGLTRVRGFTQDDAHIICSADQIESELKKVIDFILFIYKSFGFNIEDISVYLSVRDPEINKYAGKEDGWNFTEKILEKIALDKKLNIKKDVGGAVFYGPKLDFKIKDAIGREWQCSTLQFDFNLPEAFDMFFINKEGEKERPYMLHRALFGSFERFIGVLIEHYAGALPFWISPVQIKIISVSDQHETYCNELLEYFLAKGFRVELDLSDNTVGNKVRKSITEKIPYILVIGDKEISSNKLTIRERNNSSVREISKEGFISELEAL